MVCYGLKHKSDDVLMKSSSGGAFTAISDIILEQGGFVFGAVYNYETDSVYHIGTNEREIRDKMCGSKYIQSDINNTFQQVRQLLLQEKYVMFTGTICQISGLKRYLELLKCPTDKLILCDIICHGVGSPLIWKAIVHKKEKECGIDQFDKISFRNKDNGWCASHVIGSKENNVIEIPEYMKLFYGHGIMRESCYKCPFTSPDRCSDITIGDFWGVKETYPEFYSDKGVSFVMTNSAKGEEIIDFVKYGKNVDCIPVNIESVHQPNFYHPAKRSVIKDRLWTDFNNKGMECVVSVYANESFMAKMRLKIIKILEAGKSVLKQ